DGGRRLHRGDRTGELERQVERERTAFARRALERELAAEQVRQFAADRETEARTAIFAAGAGVRLLECFEDDLLLLGGDADTGVCDFERHYHRRFVEDLVLRVPSADRGCHVEPHTAVLRELEGV